MEITLKLNEQEANNIIQLLDIAVKAGGLANAAVALPIVEQKEPVLVAESPAVVEAVVA